MGQWYNDTSRHSAVYGEFAGARFGCRVAYTDSIKRAIVGTDVPGYVMMLWWWRGPEGTGGEDAGEVLMLISAPWHPPSRRLRERIGSEKGKHGNGTRLGGAGT